MIYLDNAATSWPKPEAVYQTVDKVMRQAGANPGRSGHTMALAADRVIQETRRLTAQLFSVPDPSRIIFTLNATDALNLALKGLLQAGDHVITGSMEHNALARPLEALCKTGVEVSKVATSPFSGLAAADIRTALRPNTKLIAVSHASNVTGTLNPIVDIARVAKAAGVLLLVDCAQTAGLFPIDVGKMGIDLLAFPGHKALFGCQGVGGLYIGRGISLKPLREGGTGSRSESLEQPEECPDRYESGTLNTPGIAGLGAGIRFILETGQDIVRRREEVLTNMLLTGLEKIRPVVLYGPSAGKTRAAVVSFGVPGIDPAEISLILDQSFQIASRAGLHCAPDAHLTLGTSRGGTVRLSPGYFTTEAEIEQCLQAVAAVIAELC
ncbi:aminotransferase class V-fold PLP-dependent enzyme|uniref:cysteine desulfurase n=1 Tax=Dendrosporobacter quercicolus TaxID=146817 RepID=A0A1G9S2F4_9FIRM|nr:aminotransferase class V-fold PLP-dependent enzyme [Dendrosporobacter quercicolus]NSL49487.1 aminotransferase class V-fold PLP-dependent enzyme [Dendrosporobacter quercicolus DSM 1736]SDM29656.1 cysteine desulfurase family protein [Dendrosporobacter quercicolus]